MGRSKRERKDRYLHSLKRKRADDSKLGHFDPDQDTTEDANALVLPPSTKKTAGAAPAPQKQVSKAQQRKLRQVAQEKQRRQHLAQAYQVLEDNKLSEEQLRLLTPTAMQGQKLSKRQRLSLELAQERAGLKPGADASLHRRRTVRESAEALSEASSEDELAPSQHPAKQLVEPASQSPAPTAAHPQPQDSAPLEASAVPAQPQDHKQLREAIRAARQHMGLAGEEQEAAGPVSAAEAGTQQAAAPVLVSRSPEVVESRSKLPILGMEQEIMEGIAQHDILVLCGETGCGKTTQVPQFLYEGGFRPGSSSQQRAGRVGITQPRRVAAAAAAQRVAHEMQSPVGDTVGFQVRHDVQCKPSTAVKFMTDGILLRELQSDFLLSAYSCLVIDEAHERSLSTDLLLGAARLLSRIVPLRRQLAQQGKATPLKLIIMSATLATADFLDNRSLFPVKPPLIEVPARQYPVTIHFNRRTELHDYLGAAYRKVSQIHRQLPQGGILVFVTGQREVQHLCRRLQQAFSGKAPLPSAKEHEPAGPVDAADIETSGADAAEAQGEVGDEPEAAAPQLQGEDDFEAVEADEEEDEVQHLGGEGFSAAELAAAEAALGISSKTTSKEAAEDKPLGPVHVLPLYAMLPGAAQKRVFQPVPEGHRLIVVATNVAETSLTIPGITYVVDAGRAKQKLLQPAASVARYDVSWISKASAAQRAGRAGRTAPGHTYRLYSSAHFNDTFSEHTPPEILNSPLDAVVLSMKSLGIDKVQHFPFPSPPPDGALSTAASMLTAIGGLFPEAGWGQGTARPAGQPDGLTPMGARMAQLPVSPRHARLLLQVLEAPGKQAKTAIPYACALAAVLSVETPFVAHDAQAGKEARQAQAKLRVASSDALSALAALLGFLAARNQAQYCRQHLLHERNLREAAALHGQLRRVLLSQSMCTPKALSDAALLSPATDGPVAVRLRRAVMVAHVDQVARRVRSAANFSQLHKQEGKPTRAVRYQVASSDTQVFLHPASTLHKTAPEWVVYSQLVQTDKRIYMSGVTSIKAEWLAACDCPLRTVSPPLEEPQPCYQPRTDRLIVWHDVAFGHHLWDLPRLAQPLEASADIKAAVFLGALLQGDLLPCLKGLQQHLAIPVNVRRAFEQGSKQASCLVHAAAAAQVFSCKALAAAWQTQNTLLQAELQACLQKPSRPQLQQLWPRMLQEAVQLAAM